MSSVEITGRTARPLVQANSGQRAARWRSLTRRALAWLAAIAIAATRASAQAVDVTPPTVIITPAGTTVATSTIDLSIDWCDTQSTLVSTSRSITVNGTSVGSTFVSSTKAGCVGHATSTVTVNLASGNNQVVAHIDDKSLNTGTGSQTYVRNSALPLVSVTPKGTVVNPEPGNVATQSFTVQSRIGATTTFTLGRSCPATYGCSAVSSIALAAGAAGAVSITYTPQSLADSGTIKLWATGGGGTDTGSVLVRPRWASHLVVSTAFNNGDQQRSDLCASGCFAATAAVSTVPYFTMGAGRSITLGYNSDRVNPRTPVYADVSFTAGATLPSELTLQVRDSTTGGAYVFANGDTTLHFAGSLGRVRLAGILKTDLLATGSYPVAILVSSIHGPGHVDSLMTYSRLGIVNLGASRIAAGWGIVGVQRLVEDASHAVMVYDDAGGEVTLFPGPSGYWAPSSAEHSVLAKDTTYLRIYDDGTKVRFDANGRMTLVSDRFGNAVRYAYDDSGRVVRIYDPFRSRTGGADTAYITLDYGSTGLSRITEPGPLSAPTAGRHSDFIVDGSHLLTRAADPDGQYTTFAYDAQQHLSAVTGRNGGVRRYYYDPLSSKLVRTVSPAIQVDAGALGTVVDSAVTLMRPWQAFGAPSAHTSSSALAPVYPTDSTRAIVTDPGGHATSYSADRWGQPLRSVALDGRVTTYVRSGLLPVRITYPNGTSDTLSYDGSGYVIRSQTGIKPAVTYTYGPFRQPGTVSVAGVEVQRYYVSAVNGQVDSARSAGVDSIKSRWTYDARGRMLQATDPKNHTITYHWDPVTGNADSVAMVGGRWTVHRFDAVGRDSIVINSGESPKRLSYDLLNRPTAQYDGSNALPTVFAYDSLSSRVTDPKGQVFRTDYNTLGWTIRRYDPDATKGSIYYRYNTDGLLTSVINRRGQRLQFGYDPQHRLTSKGGAADVTATYTYSADGRQITAAGAWDTVTTYLNSAYDVDSTVTRMFGKWYRMTAHRDNAGNVDALGWTSSVPALQFASRGYAWDPQRGLLTGMSVNGQSTSFTYNADGQRTVTSWPSATRTDAYTGVHTLGQSSYSTPALDNAFWRGYDYDKVGRITTRDTKIEGRASQTVSTTWYGYTTHGQLSFADDRVETCSTINYPVDSGSGLSGCTVESATPHAFAYDTAGNRTDPAATYRVGNRDSTFNGTTLDFDADGNLVHRRVTATGAETFYTWSADGYLVNVQTPTVSISFSYGVNGQPIRRLRNGITDRIYLWDNTPQLIAELDSSGGQRISEYAYEPGIDRPFALVTGATTITAVKYFVLEPTGSVAGIANGGSVDQSNLYDPWGAPTVSGSSANRLLWKSLFWEPDVGLYYVRARWYDPGLGHFISEDPLGPTAGVNMYSFGGRDPINRRDPSGTIADDDNPDCILYGRCGSSGSRGACSIILAGCPLLTFAYLPDPPLHAVGPTCKSSAQDCLWALTQMIAQGILHAPGASSEGGQIVVSMHFPSGTSFSLPLGDANGTTARVIFGGTQVVMGLSNDNGAVDITIYAAGQTRVQLFNQWFGTFFDRSFTSMTMNLPSGLVTGTAAAGMVSFRFDMLYGTGTVKLLGIPIVHIDLGLTP